MEKEKVKLDSKAASPMPSRLEDQALSGQWLGAGDGSGLQPCSNLTRSCHEGSQGEACTEQQLFPEETSTYQEESQGEACIEQELSLEEVCSCHEIFNWDECIQEEVSHSDVSSYQELSDWEEFIKQELSNKEDSVDEEVSRGNGNRPSVEPSWQSDSNPHLMQHTWEAGIGDKPLLHEEDEWDGVSVLDLREDPEERERLWAGLSAGGFPGAAPREAWVELGPSEPCSPGLCCASPACVEAPVPIRQCPSWLRRALRALRCLLRCPCLAPQWEQ
ncbi:hypothetical protein Nmel_001691 [Mimus melanotis]